MDRTPAGADGTPARVRLALGPADEPDSEGWFAVGEQFTIGGATWLIRSVEDADGDEFLVRIELVRDEGWDYSLAPGDVDGSPEENGVILRVQAGSDVSQAQAQAQAQVAAPDGTWQPSAGFPRAHGEAGESASGLPEVEAVRDRPVPVTAQRARQLLTAWVAQGRLDRLPGILPPLGGYVPRTKPWPPVRQVPDPKDHLLFYLLPVPESAAGWVNVFVIDGSDYGSLALMEADAVAAMEWLQARGLEPRVDPVPLGSRDARGLPTWQQYRWAAEWDDRGFAGWSSWGQARAALAQVLPPADVDRLGEVYAFAAAAHVGQVRPAGEPYVAHLTEVLQILAFGAGYRDADQLSAGLLHDVVEDTAVTLPQLQEHFGSSVAELVSWLTIPSSASGATAAAKGEVRAAYFARLWEAPTAARQVKLADRYSNVQRLDTHPRPDKRRRYFDETVKRVVPLAMGDPFFEPLLDAWQRRIGAALGLYGTVDVGRQR